MKNSNSVTTVKIKKTNTSKAVMSKAERREHRIARDARRNPTKRMNFDL